MKFLRLFWVVSLTVSSARAASALPALAGFPFNPGKLQIVWLTQTNQWPEKLWTYKVIPQVFSPAALSNAMAISGFKENDRKRHRAREYPYNHREMRYYTNEDETRFLIIFPPHGLIEYYTDGATAIGRAPIEGVPSDQEVYLRALEIIGKLGISTNELATKPGVEEFRTYRTATERTRYSRNTNTEPQKIVVMRGTSFVRKLDGYDIVGTGPTGGFLINFGNNSQISHLTLIWRNYVRDKQAATATPEEIVSRIKKNVFVSSHPPEFFQGEGKLTINRATIKYSGADEEERQKISLPLIQLECEVATAQTNVIVRIEGPILDNE